jgi:hypothetical protein
VFRINRLGGLAPVRSVVHRESVFQSVYTPPAVGIIRVRAEMLGLSDPLELCFPFDDAEEAIACLWQFEVRVDVLVLTHRMHEGERVRIRVIPIALRHRGHSGHSATNGQRKDGSERHVDC